MSDSEWSGFPIGMERPSWGETHLVVVLRVFGFPDNEVEVSVSEWFRLPIGVEKASRGVTHLVVILRVVWISR